MRLYGSKRLSAMVTPNGIHLVEYRRGTRGLQILDYVAEPAAFSGAESALDALAQTVEAHGGRGGRLSVAISGLGTCNQILTLPGAPREILISVVERELRRFYPSVFERTSDPIVDFVPIGSAAEGPGAPIDLLATAIPKRLIEGLVTRLDARGVVTDHLTILPRVLERLYQTFSESEGASAVMLLIPNAPLLGFFFEGRLRLYSEPTPRDDASGDPIPMLVEHVQRGALFLRQQFQGETVENLVVSGPDSAIARLEEAIDIPLERFDAYGDSPGALAALGAALDGDDEEGFNLLPLTLRPPKAAERWIRFAMAIAAALLIVAGSWWTAEAIRREARAESVARQSDLRVASLNEEFAAILPALQERRSHAARLALVDSLFAGRTELLEILWALEVSGEQIAVDGLIISNDGNGWAGTLRGRTISFTSQEASAAVEGLLLDLAANLTASSVDLTAFHPADPEPENQLMDPMPPVAVSFEVSFIGANSPGD